LLASMGWMIWQHSKDGAKRYYRDKIKQYDTVIQADPRNTAARSAMAATYYSIGELDNAIAAMELAVQIAPASVKESYQLKQWLQERELRDSRTITCVYCHTKNIWGERLCRTCRQVLVYPESEGWVKTAGSKLTAGTAIALVVWIVIAAAAVKTLTVKQAGLVVLCATCTGFGWLLLNSKKR
jgi:hypothetical protein